MSFMSPGYPSLLIRSESSSKVPIDPPKRRSIRRSAVVSQLSHLSQTEFYEEKASARKTIPSSFIVVVREERSQLLSSRGHSLNDFLIT